MLGSREALFVFAQAVIDDALFAQQLTAEENIAVVPGTYLARDAQGVKPGQNRIRLALVAPRQACVEAIERGVAFARRL